MAKKTYNVLTPVEFDKRYEPGEPIDLEDKDAEALLAVKAVELAPVAQAGGATTAPTDAAERQAAIVAAIGELDKENLDLWLKDSKPATEAIAVITGWSLTAVERNTAWASMQPAV